MATTLEHSAGPATNAPRFARLRAIGWRHWLREVAVIAAGAFAALAAQAWWQGRQDAERERDYLRNLLADTRENAHRIAQAVVVDSVVAINQRRLGDAVYGAGALPPADTLLRYLVGYAGALSGSDFQPVIGTYAALLSSGDLRLIRDERLRRAVVAYTTRLESERENFRLYNQEAFGDVSRFTRALPFMRRVSSDRAATLAEGRRFAFARLRDNPDFDAVLFAVGVGNTNRLNHLRSMRDETRTLLALLETQRAGSEKPPARDTSSRGAR